jgi:hypothetical protein
MEQMEVPEAVVKGVAIEVKIEEELIPQLKRNVDLRLVLKDAALRLVLGDIVLSVILKDIVLRDIILKDIVNILSLNDKFDKRYD